MTDPASNLSVPLTIVKRTAVKTAPRATEPAPRLLLAISERPVLLCATQVFPVKFTNVKNPFIAAVAGNAATIAKPEEKAVPTEAPALITAVTAPM